MNGKTLAIRSRLGYEELMKETYTAVIKQSGTCWIGRIEEVRGVNCHEVLESARFYKAQQGLGWRFRRAVQDLDVG